MRDPSVINANLLIDAIDQARNGLVWRIEKVERRGSLIRVDGAENFVFFRINESHAGNSDEVSGEAMPTPGGTSFDLSPIPASAQSQADREWRAGDRNDT
jgi:hypothetical protein